MHTIFFGMSKVLTSEDRECATPDGFHAALAIFDALCARFVRVDLYGPDGALLRYYDNI